MGHGLKKFFYDEFVKGKKAVDWLWLIIGLILQTIAVVIGYVSGKPESIWLIISGLSGVVAVVLRS